MNLHEYQAKDIFRSFGIAVPPGNVAGTPEEAVAAARALGDSVWVVKAQVHAGGRGKAGLRPRRYTAQPVTWMPPSTIWTGHSMLATRPWFISPSHRNGTVSVAIPGLINGSRGWALALCN